MDFSRTSDDLRGEWAAELFLAAGSTAARISIAPTAASPHAELAQRVASAVGKPVDEVAVWVARAIKNNSPLKMAFHNRVRDRQRYEAHVACLIRRWGQSPFDPPAQSHRRMAA